MFENILYKSEIHLIDGISIQIPTVGEVLEDEGAYFNQVSLLTSMPIDLMVPLDEMGVDFAEISEYDLFLRMFYSIKEQDTHLIFGDLDISKFEVGRRIIDNSLVLYNPEKDITIDKKIASGISEALRKIHHLKKNRRKPGNKEARDYMLERAKTKAKRNKNKKQDSQIEPLIVAMVNTQEFKYNYDQVKSLSIYQFNESVQQIIHKVDFNNKMLGVYTGNLDTKKLKQDELNWLVH